MEPAFQYKLEQKEEIPPSLSGTGFPKEQVIHRAGERTTYNEKSKTNHFVLCRFVAKMLCEKGRGFVTLSQF